jgi:UDP-glucose 4-epimerase
MVKKNGSKILVTGGAGFIGSHLVDRLIKEGHKVTVVDNLSTGKNENLNPKVKFYKTDICNKKLREIFKKEKPEIVFHLAAQIDVRKSTENPIEDAKINILGSLNVLENCRKAGVKKLIFASSGGAIYGESEVITTLETHPARPESPYGLAKFLIEKYLEFYKKTYGLDYISLRYANVYGPRQNSKIEAGVIAIFIDTLLHGKRPTIFGHGNQTRDYVYVDDAVEAAIKAMAQKGGRVFNVGTGIETSVNELYKLISQKLKKDIQPKFVSAKPGDLKRSCLDSSKIKKELGWQPKYPLEKGLNETIKWFKNESH